MQPGSRVLWGCSAPSPILPHHLSCVKMAAFQFYLQLGKQRKERWMVEDSHVIFGKKLPSGKRSVVAMQQPVLLWPKFWVTSSHILTVVSLDFPCTAHAFFPECLSNHCQGLHLTFSETCDAVPFSDTSQNRFRPDTQFQLKRHKKLTHPPSCMKSVNWLPRYASTIINNSIALQQLL
jgi:hypothetical protein